MTFSMCADCETLGSELNSGRPFEEQTPFEGLFEDCSETDDKWLSRIVAIKAKRGAKIPEWAEKRLKGDEEE
jgi:hypothetical protein